MKQEDRPLLIKRMSDISQGNGETHLSYGRHVFDEVVTNLLLSLVTKIFWKICYKI